MEEQNNKNLILAMVLSAVVMIVWFIFFPPPEPSLARLSAACHFAADMLLASGLPPTIARPS